MEVRLLIALTLIAAAAVTSAQELLPNRDVFVRSGAPPGGDGTRYKPYSSIQEMVEKHDAVWGQVFLHPGVYEEDVDIHRGRFWFMPAQQYDVIIKGSITIRRPGIYIRGLDFQSEGAPIILAEGATGCQIQQNRILSVGEGHAGIDLRAQNCADCLISDNIIDLRETGGENRTGIRVSVGQGVTGNRLDHNQLVGCETGIAFVPGEGVSAETNIATSNRIEGNGVGMELAAPGVTARYNRFERNTAAAIRATAGATVLVANTFWSNVVAMQLAGDTVAVRSNVVIDTTGPAIDVTAGSATVLHNTLYSSSGGGPLLQVAEGATLEARHNILDAPGEAAAGPGAPQLSGNLYSPRMQRPAADTQAIVGDPGFSNAPHGDFHITPDSPAAHAAREPEVTTDADGIGRPWGPAASIGAYEVAGPVNGRTLHVRPGVEGGDGSVEAPFGTISAATERARPGDTIIIASGEYDPGEETIECSGAPDAPITIKAEAPLKTVLTNTRLRLERCSYLQIRDIHFTDIRRIFLHIGPYCRHCAVIGNVAERKAEGGGNAISVIGPGSQYNLFEGNTIALTHGAVGININCQRYNWHQTLRNNDISGCYYGCQSGGGSYPTAPPGYHIIEGNTFHDNWKDGVHTKGTDQIIVGNHFYNNAGHAITTRYGSRNVIIGNYLHDNGHGIRLHSPSHFVINNLIYNNKGIGIHASSWPGGDASAAAPFNFEPSYEPAHEIWIANNTIYGNGKQPIDCNTGARLMLLRNIIVGNGPDEPAITFANGAHARQVAANIYFNCRRPILREYEGGAYDRVTDPEFTNPEAGDFRPRPGSPAWSVPELNDALTHILSQTPAGVRTGNQIGSSLPPRE